MKDLITPAYGRCVPNMGASDNGLWQDVIEYIFGNYLISPGLNVDPVMRWSFSSCEVKPAHLEADASGQS